MARSANLQVREQIAKNLGRILRERKLSVGEAAKRLTMPQSQVSGYLREHRGFSVETLLRFAATLNCALDDLVRGVDMEYTRQAAQRRYPDLGSDGDLMDVVTGFDTIRQSNPREAASIAMMLRARMLGEAPQTTGALNAAPSADAVATKLRRVAPVQKRARGQPR